jgi:D-alanyl-D-alanine carboxypeptidase/D-alanyl-D-alanine-endopeptidase (penicillin-binding protein 4)
MSRVRLFFAWLFLIVSPAVWPQAAGDPVQVLHRDLETIVTAGRFAKAQWGVKVISLDKSEMLYEHDSERLLMPASNNKLLTGAISLVRLGPDFHFQTRIMAEGSIADGVLKGNLVIVGSGDPGVAPRFHSGDPFGMFKEWAGILKDRGIHVIEGDIAGDASAFDNPALGEGWQWDDLPYGYATPVSALQFNENQIVLEITPGARPGDPASIKAQPLPDYMVLESRMQTVAAGSQIQIQVDSNNAGESMVVRGTVPARGNRINQTVAVRNPTRYFLEAFKRTLQQEGVNVSMCSIRDDSGRDPAGLTLLWSHPSPPLSEILKPLFKASQNLYAESLVRTLGLAFKQEGSFYKGREIVEETLLDMSIGKEEYYYADGSGLSRLNLASADLLVKVLEYIYRREYSSCFYDALSIAGVDGTLSERMRGSSAENNVRAKTGSFSSARALSGYVRTADGEMLAFSIIANGFLQPGKEVERAQDSMAELLARFSRKEKAGAVTK